MKIILPRLVKTLIDRYKDKIMNMNKNIPSDFDVDFFQENILFSWEDYDRSHSSIYRCFESHNKNVRMNKQFIFNNDSKSAIISFYPSEGIESTQVVIHNHTPEGSALVSDYYSYDDKFRSLIIDDPLMEILSSDSILIFDVNF